MRFAFAALVVVGDSKGQVGYGSGKAQEVSDAIRKAIDPCQAENGPRALARGPHAASRRTGITAPAGLSPCRAVGTGIITGGPIRAVFETMGVAGRGGQVGRHANPHNMVKRDLRGAEDRDAASIAARGKSKVSSLPSRRVGGARSCCRIRNPGSSRVTANPTAKGGQDDEGEHIGSPIRRHHSQRETLIGLISTRSAA